MSKRKSQSPLPNYNAPQCPDPEPNPAKRPRTNTNTASDFTSAAAGSSDGVAQISPSTDAGSDALAQSANASPSLGEKPNVPRNINTNVDGNTNEYLPTSSPPSSSHLPSSQLPTSHLPPINEVLLEDCIGYVVSFLKADKCELWNVAQLSRGFLLGAKLRLSQFLKRSNSDIHQAAQLWCKSKNKKKAEIEYGHISEWDVSHVTNMACLFQGRRDFNEDLSKWNVSNVKNMGGMFWGCIHFNNDSLSNWNVGSVKKMQYMFARADAFNGDITRWNTENVEDMQYMFGVSKSFNQDLSNWNVEKCKNMMEMFRQAYIFSSDLSSWNVQNVTSMFAMFYRATSFNNDTIKNWDLTSIKKGHRPTRKCAKNSPTMIQQR